MLRRRVQLTPARPAFQYPDARDAWQTYSWSDVGEIAEAAAAALLSAGVEHEQRVAISATTRVEWILACYGIGLAGAATTTIYPNTTDEDVAFILSDSGSVVAFVEDAEQAAKITAHAELDDQVRLIVTGSCRGTSSWPAAGRTPRSTPTPSRRPPTPPGPTRWRL
jgi:long-chain acyl-CoA synthetase